MNDQQGFLDAIIAQPDDDSLRLIYADWLDEHGDADRAEFIRVQCELARLSEEDDRRPALEDREHEVLGQHETEWLGELPKYLPEWRFERGFLTFLRTDSRTLLDHGQALFARHPITRLRIERPDVYELGPIDELGQEPWLERVEDLDTEVFPPVLTSAHLHRVHSLRLRSVVGPDPEALDFLGRCPSLSQLRSLNCRGLLRGNFLSALLGTLKSASVSNLDLGGCEMRAGQLTGLLRAPFASSLNSLGIAENLLGATAWQAFQQLPAENQLRQLDVSGTSLAAEGLASLLQVPSLTRLAVLALSGATDSNDHEERDLEALGRSAFWDRAEELRLHDVTCSGAVVAPLCRPTGTKRLRVLDLGDMGLRTEGVRRLCAAPFADSLIWLDLCRNYLDDAALEHIAASGRFTRLRHLDLRVNGPKLQGHNDEQITDAGVERLARAPNLARLRHINLHATAISTQGVDAVLNGPHWKLSGLIIGNCDLSPDVVPVLANSPRLARLTELRLAFNGRLGGRVLLPLAESPYLSPLCCLDVGGIQTDDIVHGAFRKRLGRRWRG